MSTTPGPTVTQPAKESTIRDIDLVDEVTRAAVRARALFYAITGLPNMGSVIKNKDLSPLGELGMGEIDKIIELIDTWHEQNRRPS